MFLKGTCIVNAYCQFSQQACTNFMQIYLYLLISTHFFILTTNLHWLILTCFFIHINNQFALNNIENRKSALGLVPKLFKVFWLGTTGRRRSRGLSRGLNKRVNKSQLEFHSRRLLLSRTGRATWDSYFFYPTTCCSYR